MELYLFLEREGGQWGCDPQVENHLRKCCIGLLSKSEVTEEKEGNIESVLQ